MQRDVLMILPLGACLAISLLALYITRNGTSTQRRLVTLVLTGLTLASVFVLPDHLKPFAKGIAGGSIGGFLLNMVASQELRRREGK